MRWFVAAVAGALITQLAPATSALSAADLPTTSGPPAAAVRVGASSARPDGIGYYNQSDRTLHLRNDATTAGPSNYAYSFGPADPSVPIVVFSGDWDGDGVDGVGYYNRADGTFHLRNDATRPGRSDYAFTFGPVDPQYLQPVVGDWNGSGRDGVGYIQSNYAHLRNDATRPGGSNFVVHYQGSVGAPFSGDWDGDGKAGLGFVGDVCGTDCQGGIDTQLFVREPATTTTDAQFVFETQSPNDFDQSIVVAGDWNGDGRDGLAVLNNDDYGPLRLFNDVHASGDTPDYSYQVGEAGFLPRILVAGHWH